MPPVGLLAIVALGLTLAYALPQRAREREDYALVRVDDRYSADMRVVRSSARRVEPKPTPATKDAAAPLLVTGEARAKVSALGEMHMSRPAAPLDRAATVAKRQMVRMQKDRAATLQRRARAARRRAVVGTLAFLATAGAWGAVTIAAAPLWAAVASSTVLASTVVAGRKAVATQRKADARLVPVAQEVVTTATAATAINRVAEERAHGNAVVPSIEETQAIEVVTAAQVTRPLPFEEEDVSWSPRTMPVPSYTLKAEAPTKAARPITDEDLEQGIANAAGRAAQADEEFLNRERAKAEAYPTTATLDDILARRKRHSA